MGLIVLPGMGASADMYGEPWRALSGARYIDWPEYRGETSVAQVAERVIREHEVTNKDIPVGSSLGGMVALQMAAALGCSTACLIGSAVRREEINPLLTAVAPLAELTPMKWAQLMAGKSGGTLASDFAQADPQFIKAMCRAVAEWPAVSCGRVRVVRLHGTHDWVIRCPEDTHRIQNGGHLIACTHAEECVSLVRRHVLQLEQSSP